MINKICDLLFTSKKFFYFFVLLLLCINLSIIVNGFAHKNQYHIDEQWSYAHSNSNGKPYIAKPNMYYEWFDSKVYHNYLTVQKSDGFNYSHIYENLKLDMHTPLYFMALYTISYLFPDTFNPWLGGVLNIFLWLITLFVMYRLSQKFFKNKWLVLAPVILYAFSIIGISTVSYIRVYLMQTLFATCLINEMLEYTLKEKNNCKVTLLKIFIFSLLGMLTSYNSLILSFVLSVVFGIYMLYTKDYAKIFYLALAMIGSVIFFIYIFPYAYIALVRFSPQRYNSHKDLFEIFRGFLTIYFTELFSIHIDMYSNRIYTYIAVVIFMWLIAIYVYSVNFVLSKKTILLLIVYSVISTYLFYSMPEMGVFGNRYTMFLYPTMSILSIYMIYKIVSAFFSDHKSVVFIYIVILLNTLNINYQTQSPYLRRLDDKEVEIVNNLKNKNLMAVSERNWDLEGVSFVYMNAHQIYFFPKKIYDYFVDGHDDKSPSDDDYEKIDKICRDIAKADYLMIINNFSEPSQSKLCDNVIRFKFVRNIKISTEHFDVYEIIPVNTN